MLEGNKVRRVQAGQCRSRVHSYSILQYGHIDMEARRRAASGEAEPAGRVWPSRRLTRKLSSADRSSDRHAVELLLAETETPLATRSRRSKS